MPGLARRGAVAVNPGFAVGTNARLLETLASGSKSLKPIGVGLKIESAAFFRTPGRIVSAIKSLG